MCFFQLFPRAIWKVRLSQPLLILHIVNWKNSNIARKSLTQNVIVQPFCPAKYIGFHRPQRSWGKVIFSEACVKNSIHGGDCLPHCLLGYTTHLPLSPPPPRPEADALPPRDQRQAPPPRNRAPGPEAQRQVLPPAQCMLGYTGNKQAVRILLKCDLV